MLATLSSIIVSCAELTLVLVRSERLEHPRQAWMRVETRSQSQTNSFNRDSTNIIRVDNLLTFRKTKCVITREPYLRSTKELTVNTGVSSPIGRLAKLVLPTDF